MTLLAGSSSNSYSGTRGPSLLWLCHILRRTPNVSGVLESIPIICKGEKCGGSQGMISETETIPMQDNVTSTNICVAWIYSHGRSQYKEVSAEKQPLLGWRIQEETSSMKKNSLHCYIICTNAFLRGKIANKLAAHTWLKSPQKPT